MRLDVFVLAGAAEGIVLDVSDDGDDVGEDEDSATGVMEVVENRLVEFAREFTGTLSRRTSGWRGRCRRRNTRGEDRR